MQVLYISNNNIADWDELRKLVSVSSCRERHRKVGHLKREIDTFEFFDLHINVCIFSVNCKIWKTSCSPVSCFPFFTKYNMKIRNLALNSSSQFL